MINSFFENVGIEEMVFAYPPEVWPSEEIEKLNPLYQKLSLPLGRLELMTGIKKEVLFRICSI